MMTIERVLQICIVLACVVVLFSRFSSIGTVDAQGCGGSPPVDPDYLTEAWLQGSSVSVKIHEKNNGQETSQPEFDAIDSAIKSWNSIKVSGCSNVTFGNATRTNTVWGGFTAPPPSANEVFVVRTEDRDGQFLEIGTPTGLAGGWLFMRSSFNHILIPPGKGPLYRVDNLAKHEAGHSFGVDDGLPGHPSSAMGPLSFDASNTLQIMACDIDAHKRVYCPPTPTPTPYPPHGVPCAFPMENFSQGACPLGFSSDSTGYYCCSDACSFQEEERPWQIPNSYGQLDCTVCQDGIDNDCDGNKDEFAPNCAYVCAPSPLVVDTLGNGFDLTDPSNGVDFDIRGVGRPIRVAWTQGDDGWLALDRNGNGTIDSGKELFGNFTYQLSSPDRNGFRALAVYDEPAYGGNSDGVIDSRDTIFPSLRLWLDANRNGISEPGELIGLASKDIAGLELDYRLSKKTDAHGNEFRYRAKVKGSNGADPGRWAWDVFLAFQRQTSSRSNILLDKRDLFASYIPIFGSKKSKCRV